jgi:hypothetical protein
VKPFVGAIPCGCTQELKIKNPKLKIKHDYGI